MISQEKLALAALCFATACVSGSVVSLLMVDGARDPALASPSAAELASLPATPLKTSRMTSPIQTSALADPVLKQRIVETTDIVPDWAADPQISETSRFAFVPRHAVSPLLSPLAAALSEDENFDGWDAQTRVAPAPPSIVRLPDAAPAQDLPWQAARPRAPGATYTLSQRLAEIGPPAQTRLAQKFEAAKAPWRPAEIALVAVKDEKTLELFARPAGGSWTFIHRYPVLAASGVSGPKLRRGDKQVPEGVYRISFLNPNSRYHVSLRVDYPNAFDKRMGLRDGRKDLGGDIMIHGKAASIGCLAIGDAAAEELFVLAAETGPQKIKLVIAPTDFRRNAAAPVQPGQPAWLPELYSEIATAMAEFKAPPNGGLLSWFSN